MPVWDKPSSQPESPQFIEPEGYPAASGDSFTDWFWNSGTIREEKRIRGIIFDGEVNAIEADRFDDTRKLIYDAYRRLDRLIWMAVGPNYAQDVLGDTVHPVDNLHFAGIIEYEATLDGSQILITVDSAFLEYYLMPGDTVWARNTFETAWSQISDVEFVTQTEVILHLTQPINTSTSDRNSVFLVIESKRPTYPYIGLDNDFSQRCRHVVRAPHNKYLSYQSAFGSSGKGRGVDSYFFCSKLDEATVDLSLFNSQCQNTACPFYDPPHDIFYPRGDVTSDFFQARGNYIRETIAEAADPDDFRAGREFFPGIMNILGLPGEKQAAGGYLPIKTYASYGIARDKYAKSLFSSWTPEELARLAVDPDFDQFLNFADQQIYEEIENGANTDDVPSLTGLNSGLRKVDHAGGTDSSASGRALRANNPGYEFERAIGLERIQALDTAVSAGDSGNHTPFGPGLDESRRVRPRRYTSESLEWGADGSDLSETQFIVYATPQVVNGIDDPVYAIFRITKFSEEQDNPENVWTKSVTGTIATASESSRVLTLELDLANRQTDYTETGMTKVLTWPSGGNIVCPPVSWTVDNTNANTGDAGGDRQRLVTPGDTIYFDLGGSYGVLGFTVIEAEAYAGAEGTSNTLLAEADYKKQGIPLSVQTNQTKRDVVKVALDGRQGDLMLDYLDGGSLVGVAIDHVDQSAVGLPRRTESDRTDYDPTLKLVEASVAYELVENEDYIYDPVEGAYYIISDAGTTGEQVKMFGDQWIFDNRRIYPCEISEAMENGVDHLLEKWYDLPVDGSTGAAIIGMAMVSNGGVIDDNPYAGFDKAIPGRALSVEDVDWVLGYDGADPPYEQKWKITSVGPTQSVDFSDATNVAFGYTFQGALFPFPRGWTSNEIGSAECNITFDGLSGRWESVLAQTVDGVTTITSDSQEDLDASAGGLELVSVKPDPDDSNFIIFRSLGISISLAGLELVDETLNTWKGTVDITDAMKAMANAAPTIEDDETVYAVFAGESSLGEITQWQDVLYRYLEYSYEYIDTDNQWEYHKETQWTGGAAEISRIVIKPNAENVIGVAYGQDSSGRDRGRDLS